MSKIKQTASEAQLKARRTSLGKKSKEELIAIILRKDKSERSMNSKIQELTKVNDSMKTRINGFDADMKGMEDLVKVKQEAIDNLISEKNILIDERNEYSKDVVRLKTLGKLRRKTIYGLFSVIVLLIVLLIFI